VFLLSNNDISDTGKINWKYIVEKVFEKMPNWWPRAYMAIVALVNFRGKARPSMLKSIAAKQNIAYRTMLRGINTLINEGLVSRKNTEYEVKEEIYAIVYALLRVLNSFEREAEQFLEEDNINALKAYFDLINNLRVKTRAILEKTGIESRFIENLFIFAENYVKESLEYLSYMKRTEKLIKEILPSRKAE